MYMSLNCVHACIYVHVSACMSLCEVCVTCACVNSVRLCAYMYACKFVHINACGAVHMLVMCACASEMIGMQISMSTMVSSVATHS